jgi:hypothetical protein
MTLAHKQDPEDVTASTTEPIGWPDPSRPIISERDGSGGSDGSGHGEGNGAPSRERGEGQSDRG